jgi:hypothetical protein
VTGTSNVATPVSSSSVRRMGAGEWKRPGVDPASWALTASVQNAPGRLRDGYDCQRTSATE